MRVEREDAVDCEQTKDKSNNKKNAKSNSQVTNIDLTEQESTNDSNLN